ncbi:MAG: 2,3,4,5-tetrahydropyridine-2,6-dicarboxylate N-succinyltransferase [Proteobacteria bacterium]|nr:2,3,4,5-tetrahydropyridine-2,6-dicarboxylate N-succinyltransferase [Pseudomonadota bacterium]
MLDLLIATVERDLELREENDFYLLSRAHEAFAKFLDLLETGRARAASPDENGEYHCDVRVKKMILYGFKLGHLVESNEAGFQFCDKHNLWPDMHHLVERAVRIVPGGTTVRRGACLKSGVTLMPPAYVNIGAYIDEGTMIDSHALVGSCAQVGKRCHISAASQLGGVLEPVGAMPVIIEDNAFVGGNCGIYEGTHVHKGAVIAAGTILTKSTPLFDLVNQQVIRPVDGVLHVPENAVVIPGARAIDTDFARSMGLSAYAPIIVKYRDDKTDASIELVDLFRQK